MVLKDKIALVSGGSRGIGRSIVLAFADEGAHVAFTYKSAAEAAEKVKSEIEMLISFVKKVRCFNTVGNEIFSHPDILGSLTGEHECYLSHVLLEPH